MMTNCTLIFALLAIFASAVAFAPSRSRYGVAAIRQGNFNSVGRTSARTDLKMNFFEDAFRFFTNMNKEASAKHILIKGPDASKKLELLKKELETAEDLSAAFSELAAKVCIFL
jgi:hypothetical protein